MYVIAMMRELSQPYSFIRMGYILFLSILHVSLCMTDFQTSKKLYFLYRPIPFWPPSLIVYTSVIPFQSMYHCCLDIQSIMIPIYWLTPILSPISRLQFQSNLIPIVQFTIHCVPSTNLVSNALKHPIYASN